MRNKSLSTLVLGVISGAACGVARVLGTVHRRGASRFAKGHRGAPRFAKGHRGAALSAIGHRGAALSTIGLAVLLTGCLEVPQNGVTGGTLVPVTKLMNQPERVYTVGPCRMPDGSTAPPMQGSEYEWRHSGLRSTLYEHRPDEPQGRLIDNAWQDDASHHYFVWMAEANGFEYVVPKDDKKSGMVRKFVRPEVHAERTHHHTVYRPAGQPEEICELLLTR